MRRTVGSLVLVGLICGGGVVYSVLRRRRRPVSTASGVAAPTESFSDTVNDKARWEGEGGAVLPQ